MIDQNSFTPEQIAQMRQILAVHDKGSGQLGGMKEFDLNNPPKLPYKHQEYPKHLGYDAKGKLLIAKSTEDEEKLGKLVKSKTPPAPKKVREKIDMTETGEVAEETA
jgi:hypothetical protein